MFCRRVHILLDEARYEKLTSRAERRGVSVGAVIHQAVDAIRVAEPMVVPPNPADLRAELDDAHDRFRE